MSTESPPSVPPSPVQVKRAAYLEATHQVTRKFQAEHPFLRDDGLNSLIGSWAVNLAPTDAHRQVAQRVAATHLERNVQLAIDGVLQQHSTPPEEARRLSRDYTQALKGLILDEKDKIFGKGIG